MPRSTSSSFETETEVNGIPTPVTVEYRWSAGHPGKTYGDPENCYPPEGDECEVEVVYLTSDKTKTDIMPSLKTEQIETLFEQACMEGSERAGDAYEAAMEDKFDSMHEGD